jgi:hypothetical protein
LVLLGIRAETIESLAAEVAVKMAESAKLEAGRVETAFVEAMRGEDFSIGKGVVIPHLEMTDLSETAVCLVTLRQPLTLRTIDGRACEQRHLSCCCFVQTLSLQDACVAEPLMDQIDQQSINGLLAADGDEEQGKWSAFTSPTG